MSISGKVLGVELKQWLLNVETLSCVAMSVGTMFHELGVAAFCRFLKDNDHYVVLKCAVCV